MIDLSIDDQKCACDHKNIDLDYLNFNKIFGWSFDYKNIIDKIITYEYRSVVKFFY